MIVYTYNENNEFTGIHECQKCPETGGWLYPARYTEIEITPKMEFKKRIFDGKKWIYKDTDKGKEIYNKETKQKIICIEDLISDEYTEIAPPKEPYYKWINNEWVVDYKLKKEYDITIIQSQLSATDKEMSRISEDLIDALDSKNVLEKTDLPADAIEKINNRKALREQLANLLNQ